MIRDRGDASEVRGRGFVATTSGMRPGADHGRGDDRSDTGLGEQVGTPRRHDRHDCMLVDAGFGLHAADPVAQVAQDRGVGAGLEVPRRADAQACGGGGQGGRRLGPEPIAEWFRGGDDECVELALRDVEASRSGEPL